MASTFSCVSIALFLLVIVNGISPKPVNGEQVVLPEKLLVGYVSHCGDGLAENAVEEGVNVLVWCFWGVHSDGSITTRLNLACIEQVQNNLRRSGYDYVIHLSSIGGWNGGHLHDKLTSLEIYQAWQKWGGHLFDEIDWDLEGNDNLQSELNYFSLTCLEQMGEMSRLAKEDGYIVSLVPPQSYLDFGTEKFSRYVNLTNPIQIWHSDFHYYGSNIYAYVLSKYGPYIDFVMIQLYESYSKAGYEITQFRKRPSQYLVDWIHQHADRGSQFYVRFEDDPSLRWPSQPVALPLSKFVIGLANGWAAGDGSGKSVFISPQQVGVAWKQLAPQLRPRGVMFWTINEEGTNGIHMAEGLNQALGIQSTRIAKAREDIS